MTPRRGTDMGGQDHVFPVTRWTDILTYVQTEDPGHRQTVMDQLAKRYWKPVYWYLRHKGCDNEQAKDLTQAFFCEIVVDRDLVGQADPQKGRFRGYLLTALNRFAASEHRKLSARKRRPDKKLWVLWTGDMCGAPEPMTKGTPQQAFLRHWASALLDAVLGEVRARCSGAGQTRHWAVFRAWVLGPIIDNAVQPPMDELCERFGIEDKKTAWNMVETVKRRFRRVLKAEVRLQVASEADVGPEIRELARILSQGGAEP